MKVSGAQTTPEVTRFEERFEIDLEPSSYRVREVQHQTDIVMRLAGREVNQHKKRSATLDWSAATGCGIKAR